jgi:hypothetical protein
VTWLIGFGFAFSAIGGFFAGVVWTVGRLKRLLPL